MFLTPIYHLSKAHGEDPQASKSSIFRSVTLSITLFAAIVSFSRILALWKYYHTPMTVMYRLQADELPRVLNATGIALRPHPVARDRRTRRNADEDPIDLSPIKEFGLRVCIGKEWYRFPGHYLVADGVRVDWIKSEFDGQLPAHFRPTKGGLRSRIAGTSAIPLGLNDLNREEPMHYVRRSSRFMLRCP